MQLEVGGVRASPATTISKAGISNRHHFRATALQAVRGTRVFDAATGYRGLPGNHRSMKRGVPRERGPAMRSFVVASSVQDAEEVASPSKDLEK